MLRGQVTLERGTTEPGRNEPAIANLIGAATSSSIRRSYRFYPSLRVDDDGRHPTYDLSWLQIVDDLDRGQVTYQPRIWSMVR